MQQSLVWFIIIIIIIIKVTINLFVVAAAAAAAAAAVKRVPVHVLEACRGQIHSSTHSLPRR
jgi:hypothetical protein